MPELSLRMDHIVVLPTDTLTFDITGILQLSYDALHRPFRDPDCQRYLAQGLGRVSRQTNQYMRVICEKIPVCGLPLHIAYI